MVSASVLGVSEAAAAAVLATESLLLSVPLLLLIVVAVLLCAAGNVLSLSERIMQVMLSQPVPSPSKSGARQCSNI